MQAAFFLLRVSFTIVRATHFMRTTPVAQWKSQSQKFDESIRSAAESILGAPFPTNVTASLLRRIADHADIADHVNEERLAVTP